jgi:hypothetical protein
MTEFQYRVPEQVVQSLQMTSALGGFEPGNLIDAAVWAFSRQDEGFKNHYVREFWFRGLGDRPRPPVPRSSLKEKLYGLLARVRARFR